MYSDMRSITVLFKDFLLRVLPIYQKILVYRLKHKKRVTVVFFAMSRAMWRYQNLYELMSRNSRFNVWVVILPCTTYSAKQQNDDEIQLMEFFESKGVRYLLGKDGGDLMDLRRTLNPDILFYPQPYNGYYPKSLSYNAFYDKLLCYVPYAFWTSTDGWSYNQPLHKVAWKLFYSTQFHREEAKRYAFRKDKNVEIVGYPNADDFLFREHINVWKKQNDNKIRRRLIWAPHFTINKGGPLYQSNFLWMAEIMKKVACHYMDELQIAFKPHPRLFSELCNHKDWGISRTQQYYDFWQSMPNTQYENGDFVDLFMTSDAMIHDSSSFCVEYLYSGNPVLYIALDYERQYEEKNTLGRLALSNHYIGRNESDIWDFIKDKVINKNDPQKAAREVFISKYLMPPNDSTVSQNIIDIILDEL